MKRLGKILCSLMLLTFIMYSIEGESIATDQTEDIEIRTIPVANVNDLEAEDWTLQFKIKKSDLFVECIVPDFSLAKDEKDGYGYLLVKMNGKKTAEMGQAAFIMKNLPPGTHKMEVTPTSYDGKKEMESIMFEVEIPSL